MRTRPIAWVIVPDGEPIFSERATRIEIVDDAAGEFIRITQDNPNQTDGVNFDVEEWQRISSTISNAINEIIRNERGSKDTPSADASQEGS